jgi:hypothetical protein
MFLVAPDARHKRALSQFDQRRSEMARCHQTETLHQISVQAAQPLNTAHLAIRDRPLSVLDQSRRQAPRRPARSFVAAASVVAWRHASGTTPLRALSVLVSRWH